MKPNPPLSYKLPLVYLAVCAVLVALSQSASAAPHALPAQSICSVPDGGATVMLLGAAVGALGIARRFLKH